MSRRAWLLLLACAGCARRRALVPAPIQTYRVCWEGPYTHDIHCGAPLPKLTALDGAERANREAPGLHHWVEPNRDGDAKQVYRLAEDRRQP